MNSHEDELREPVRTLTFPRHTIVSLLLFAALWEALSHLAPTLGVPPFAIPSLAKIAKSISTITLADIAVTLARNPDFLVRRASARDAWTEITNLDSVFR